MKKDESSKKSVRIILLVIIWVILVIWIIVFICNNYVSKEYIFEQTIECNKLWNTLWSLYNEDCGKIEDSMKKAECEYSWWKTIKEIFYNPKRNECAVAYYDYSNGFVAYLIKWMSSNNSNLYLGFEEDNYCKFYKNGEEIKKIKLSDGWWYEEPCSDRLESVWLKEIKKLKRWY